MYTYTGKCSHTYTHVHVHTQNDDDLPPLEDPSSGVVYGPQPCPDSFPKDTDIPMQANLSNVDFPLEHLSRLDDQLGRPKWVVPVRPDDDLERLLRASIKLCREGEDKFVNAMPCWCLNSLDNIMVVAESTRWLRALGPIFPYITHCNWILHVIIMIQVGM